MFEGEMSEREKELWAIIEKNEENGDYDEKTRDILDEYLEAEKWWPENVETIRCAMLADENRIVASDFYFSRIMRAANEDPELARDLANMIHEQQEGIEGWPETEEEVNENARILWRFIGED